MKKLLLICGMVLSGALLWFAVESYRAAGPTAGESLRGVALSIASTLENLANHDPSLRALGDLRPKELAFLAVVDPAGRYRFHSNPDLIGVSADDSRYGEVLRSGTPVEGRTTLGTGETAYEFFTPVHLAGKTLALRLVLHTYRADAVIRTAELNLTILLALLAAGWGLSLALYRYARREERHKLALARQESLARLGEMGAMLAHEIRNPLGGIKGFAQIIGKRPQDERNSDFARRIVAETLRLEALVTSLLSYTRSSSPAGVPVRLDELAGRLASLLQTEADAQGVAITVLCSGAVQTTGDRDGVGQVLLNLMQNALQAMPDGGTMTVAVARSGRRVTVAVGDTGAGIDPETQGKMFEPFFTTRARGTGLGLAICKKIVEEHGGTMDVKSRVGEGTTVTVTLPGVAA